MDILTISVQHWIAITASFFRMFWIWDSPDNWKKLVVNLSHETEKAKKEKPIPNEILVG